MRRAGVTSAVLTAATLSAGALAAAPPAAPPEPESIRELVGLDPGTVELVFGAATAALYLPEEERLLVLGGDGMLESATEGSRLPGVTAGEPVGLEALSASLVRTERGADSVRFDALAQTLREASEGSPYLLKRPSVRPRPAGAPPGVQVSRASAAGLGTVLDEGFESSPWQRWSRSDSTGGAYAWERTTCDSHTGSYSLDAVRGGSSGSAQACASGFPDGVSNWVWDGQCEDIRNASAAWLVIYARLEMDSQDKLGVYFPGSDQYLHGWIFQGTWTPWWRLIFNLRQWPSVGDLTQQVCNQLFVLFESSPSGHSGFGARVDDIQMVTELSPTLGCRIEASPTSGAAPLTVDFTSQLIHLPGVSPSVDWHFGDGASSTAANPRHTYTSPGDYGAMLVATDGAARCFSQQLIQVTESNPCTLTCDATASATAGVGEAVAFGLSYAASGCAGSPTFTWDFDDGGSSTLQNPTHAYSAAGTYSWSAMVTLGSKTCSDTGTLTVASSPPGRSLLVPAVAHVRGTADTLWRTDIVAVNRGSSTAEVTLTFLSSAELRTRTRSLPAGSATEWGNVLETVFGFAPGDAVSGSVRIDSTQPLVAVSRTYNQTPDGTFGQYEPALSAADALPAGTVGYLPLVRGGSDFRTNVGIANPGDRTVTARVRLLGRDGAQLGSDVMLAADPGRWAQRDRIFASAGAEHEDFAAAEVTLSPAGARAWVYASVIDNATGDPTTIPVRPAPELTTSAAASSAALSAESVPDLPASSQSPSSFTGSPSDGDTLETLPRRPAAGTRLELDTTGPGRLVVSGLEAPRQRLRLAAARAPQVRAGADLDPTAAAALEHPLAMAVADLDHDAMPEVLVVGRAEGRGTLTVFAGNPDLLFPNAPEAVARRTAGQDQGGPFREDATVVTLDREPRWVAVGDVTGDGHPDAVVAGDGEPSLLVLAGDGAGNLAEPEVLPLPGRVTALAVVDVNRPDGLDDIVVALDGGPAGPGLAVFEGPDGALRAAPELVSLPGPARAVLVGRVTDSVWPDVTAVCGDRLEVVRGRDRRLTTPEAASVPDSERRSIRLPGTILAATLWDSTSDHRPRIAVLLDDGTVRTVDATSAGDAGDAEIVARATPSLATRLVPAHLTARGRDDLLVLDPEARELSLHLASAPLTASPAGGEPVQVGLGLEEDVLAVAAARLNPDAMQDLVVLADGVPTPAAVLTQALATYVVNSSADEPDADGADGQCLAVSGSCTFRAALEQARHEGGGVTITFSVPVVRLTAQSDGDDDLPWILTGTTIDGSSQGVVEIDGSAIPWDNPAIRQDCLVMQQTSVIRNLAIHSCREGGINIYDVGGQIVEGCLIGLHRDGTTAATCRGSGIKVSSGTPGSRIGGPNAAQRNVIQGCSPGIVLVGPDVEIENNRLVGNRRFAGIQKSYYPSSGMSGTARVVDNVLIDNQGGMTFSGDDDELVILQGNQISGSELQGVGIASGNATVGGSGSGQGNTISGSGSGELIVSSARARNVVVQGNTLGDAADPGSGPGVVVAGDEPAGEVPEGVTIGGTASRTDNTIMHNTHHGVAILAGRRVSVLGNRIDANGRLGIAYFENATESTPNDTGDADDGPNGLQNHPVLQVTGDGVAGTLDSTPSATFRIELFMNDACDPSGYGEGGLFLAALDATTDAAGHAEFLFPLPSVEGVGLAATATDAAGNTSEFSPCIGSGTPMTIEPGVAPNYTGDKEFFEEPLTVLVTGEGFPEIDAELRLEGSGSVLNATDVRTFDCGVSGCSSLTAKLMGFSGAKEGPRDVIVTSAHGETFTGKDLFYVSSLVIGRPEIQQGVTSQCTSTVPCLANHRTVIRIPVECEGTGCTTGKAATVARLHVRRNGSPIAGSPFAAVAPVEVKARGTTWGSVDQWRGLDTLNFTVTPSSALAAGQYEMEVEIDPRRPDQLPAVAVKPDLKKHLTRTRKAIKFESAGRTLNIAVIADRDDPATLAQGAAAFSFLRSTYPVSEDRVRVTPVQAGISFTNEDDTHDKLRAWYTAQKQRSDAFTHVVYVTANPALLSRGLSDCGVSASMVHASPFSCNSPTLFVRVAPADQMAATAAHEIGHNFLLGDTYGGTESSRNPETEACRQLFSGCPVEDGFMDTLTVHVSVTAPHRFGLKFKDFMGNSPRQERWVDQRTWDLLRESLASSASAMSAAVGDWVTVIGTVGSDDKVTIDRVVPWHGVNDGPSLPDGDLALEAQDSDGTVLASRSFSPLVALAGDGPVERDPMPFVATVAGGASVARLRVTAGEAEAATVAASAHAPAVQLMAPNGGEQIRGPFSVHWTASDGDGDDLTFRLEYSTDGSNWTPFAIDLQGTSFPWNTATVPGSSSARLRVVASDGFNETSDASDGTFSVASKGPLVGISTPADGSVVLPGEPVELRGFAWDPEHGELADDSVEWSSSRDGILGAGSSLVVTGLSQGAHNLTLTADDGTGETGSATVRVTVSATGGPYRTLIPAVAHVAGAEGTNWRSDVAGINPTGTAAGMTARLMDVEEPDPSSAFVAPGCTLDWRDVVESVFLRDADDRVSGAVELRSQAPLLVAARTYNKTETGTFGQYLPGLTPEDGIAPGEVGILAQLKAGSDYRTNVGLITLDDAACTATVRLFSSTGSALGSPVVRSVEGGRWSQVNDIFTAAGTSGRELAYATVEVQGAGCRMWAYASVVDNRTGDPTTIPVVPDPR